MRRMVAVFPQVGRVPNPPQADEKPDNGLFYACRVSRPAEPDSEPDLRTFGDSNRGADEKKGYWLRRLCSAVTAPLILLILMLGCAPSHKGKRQDISSDSESQSSTVAQSITADSVQNQQPQSLYDWYLKHYDFIGMKDTIYTFESEFEMPEGYYRPDSADLTPFQNWVSHFPLWHRWKPIGSWKGGKAFEANQISRAVHFPWKGRGFKDYTIPIRILGEFLLYQHRDFDLKIVPVSGDTLRYQDWLEGEPMYTNKGDVFFRPTESRLPSLSEYYSFLQLCTRNTTYGSLTKNCDSLAESEVAPGDLFIVHDERGRSGQVYVIMHMLINDAGEKLYVVATGCAEACDFHIPLVNENRDYPWITAERITSLVSDLPHKGFFRLI